MLTITELKELYTKMTGLTSKGETIPEVLDEIEQAYVNPAVEIGKLKDAVEELKSKTYDDFKIELGDEPGGGMWSKTYTYEEWCEQFASTEYDKEKVYILTSSNTPNGRCVFFLLGGFCEGLYIYAEPKLYKVDADEKYTGVAISVDRDNKTVKISNPSSPFGFRAKRIVQLKDKQVIKEEG